MSSRKQSSVKNNSELDYSISVDVLSINGVCLKKATRSEYPALPSEIGTILMSMMYDESLYPAKEETSELY